MMRRSSSASGSSSGGTSVRSAAISTSRSIVALAREAAQCKIGGFNPRQMGRFLARRLVLTIPVLLGVATLVFSLIHLIPGDPAQAMLGEAAPQADVEELRRQLGLDRPLVEQYALFLGGLVGDLGTSLRTGSR